MPRVDPIRNAFTEQERQRPRYIGNWSDMVILLIPATLLSFGYLFQTPAAAPKQAPAAPKTPDVIAPGVPKVGAPAASPVKAAAAKAVAAAAKPKPALPGEPAVLTVGTEKITKAQFEEILTSLPDQFKAQFATPQGKREFAKQYAEMKSMAIEARKKMAADPKLRTQWQLQMDQTLANLLMRELVTNVPVDDASSRKYYDEHRAEFSSVNGRHILIRFKGSRVPLKPDQKDLTEEEALAKANELRKRLAAGEDFAELAKKESDDTGSGAAGGSLGDFSRGAMVPEFDAAAFALPVGQVSEAVRTAFGYHVIQIQGKKDKAFDEAKADIEKRQKPELGRKIMDEMKGRNPIVLDEAYFGKD